jgi:hypothetical protein
MFFLVALLDEKLVPSASESWSELYYCCEILLLRLQGIQLPYYSDADVGEK